MQDLQTFIDLLTKGRKLHINVCDMRGVLNLPSTKLGHQSRIHSKEFCSDAKATDAGYKACMRCKRLANAKAVKQKTSFSGYCTYGLYEAAVPLIIDGTVCAIVYVGNALPDREYAIVKIKKICRITAADEAKLIGGLDFCEPVEDVTELYRIGEIVCDYINLLHEKEPRASGGYHWLTEALLAHAKAEYASPLTLRDLAALYRKSDKYMGRLFRRETGMSFHEYCNNLRTDKAAQMLAETDEKIIDVALECGFGNIPYFNRVFRESRGMTPSEYRQAKRK